MMIKSTRLVVAALMCQAAFAYQGPPSPRQEQFALRIEPSATSVASALPPLVQAADRRWDGGILDGPRRMLVKDVSDYGAESAVKWIRRVIDAQALPKGGISVESVVFVRGVDDQPDVARAAWEFDGGQIEVSQLATQVVIRVTPAHGVDMGTSIAEKTAFARRLCRKLITNKDERYFQGRTRVPVKDVSAKIAEYSFQPQNIRQLHDGIIGVPLTMEQTAARRLTGPEEKDAEDARDNPNWDASELSFSYWWRHVCWWHDGSTVEFFFPKHDSGSQYLSNYTMGVPRWLQSEASRRQP